MPSINSRNFTRTSIPAHAGIGLKPCHYQEILNQPASTGWFEVHPENYLMAGGPQLHYLQKIRELYPLSFHSVGMSPGSADGIDEVHVRRIRTLADRFQPGFISDHLSWSQWQQHALNDLLPMPYTEAALQLMCNNIDRIQNILGRNIAIENPSSYLQLHDAEMDECDFLIELTRRSGARILLDINNIYVSACNHGWSAQDYIERIPVHQVSELHLAGHLTEQLPDGTTLRIDDHGSLVCEQVWELYALALDHLGAVPTLIEWDTNIPEFSVLQHEAAHANRYLQALRKPAQELRCG